MKSHTEYLWFNTRKHREFINITDKVEEALQKSKIKEGFAPVSVMQITASFYVNENELGLFQDITETILCPYYIILDFYCRVKNINWLS